MQLEQQRHMCGENSTWFLYDLYLVSSRHKCVAVVKCMCIAASPNVFFLPSSSLPPPSFLPSFISFVYHWQLFPPRSYHLLSNFVVRSHSPIRIDRIITHQWQTYNTCKCKHKGDQFSLFSVFCNPYQRLSTPVWVDGSGLWCGDQYSKMMQFASFWYSLFFCRCMVIHLLVCFNGITKCVEQYMNSWDYCWWYWWYIMLIPINNWPIQAITIPLKQYRSANMCTLVTHEWFSSDLLTIVWMVLSFQSIRLSIEAGRWCTSCCFPTRNKRQN